MLSSDGVEYLYTYRDPHLTESYDTFAKGPAELAARDYTEKDLNDLIVGAVAKLDTPRKPRAEARELDRQYFCGITEAMKAADRKALCLTQMLNIKLMPTAATTQDGGANDQMKAGWSAATGWPQKGQNFVPLGISRPQCTQIILFSSLIFSGQRLVGGAACSLSLKNFLS